MSTDGLKWGETPVTVGGAPLARAGRSPADRARRSCAACRAERLERVRRAVETGVYYVDALEIADRLLAAGEAGEPAVR